MISISCASSREDFETAAGLCHALGEWDVIAVQPYGISREQVLALFHTETSSSLVGKIQRGGCEDPHRAMGDGACGVPRFRSVRRRGHGVSQVLRELPIPWQGHWP